MSDLKTLKDLKEKYQCEADAYNMDEFEELVKAKAVKWVKEDRKICEDCNLLISINNKYPFCWRCNKWMKRFDITEEDLKDE